MAKGGRYLNKNQKTAKKGKGLKVLLIVLAVLIVLGCGLFFAGRSILYGMLDKVNRAEVIERDDVSDEEFQYFMTYDPDAIPIEEVRGETAEEPEIAAETTAAETEMATE